MKLFDFSSDVIRQIMIAYIDNSKINQIKIKFIGSHKLNDISDDINIEPPPMYNACKNKDTVNALLLINEEDTNYVNIYGYTLLMLACVYKMHDVALKMLNYDCKINQTNATNYTALMWACRNKMSDVALRILDFD
jgi:ankyrin repeat protein